MTYEKYKEIKVDLALVEEAKKKNYTVSEYLEQLDPSYKYDNELGKLTAIERQFVKYGIYTKSGEGYRATKLSVFNDDTTHRILFAEYVINQARVKPFFDADKYNIEALLALTRYVDSNSVRQLKIDLSSLEDGAKSKVAPAAEIPTVSVDWSEESVSLSKAGVAIEFSYEFMRRASLDLVSLVLSAINVFDRKKTFNYLVGLFVNGATTENVGAYDSSLAVGDYISYEAYLKWLNSFGIYTPNVVLADINSAIKLVTMQRPNIAPADVLTLLLEAKADNRPYIVNGGNIAKSPAIYIVDDGVLPADTIVGADTRFCFERVIEVGSDLNEYTKFIKKQTEVFTATVNEGFVPVFTDARKALVIKTA